MVMSRRLPMLRLAVSAFLLTTALAGGFAAAQVADGAPSVLATTQPASVPATQPTTRPLATQPATIATVGDVKTVEDIDVRIKSVSADTAMDADLRKSILDFYAQAKAALTAAEGVDAQTKELDAAAAAAPASAKALRQATTQPAATQPASAPAGTPLAEMEATLKKLDIDLAELKKKAETADATLRSLSAGQAELPTQIAKLREDVSSLTKKADAIRVSTDAEPLKRAQLAANSARRQELEARGRLLEKRLATADAMADLTRAQQEYFAKQESRQQSYIDAYRKQVTQRREAESRLLEEKARQELARAADAHPLVREVTKYNLYLTQLRTGDDGLNARRKRTAEQRTKIDARLARVKDNHDKAEQLVRDIGETDAIGLFLRNERVQLPDIRQHRRQSRQRQEKMAEVKVLLFRLTEKQSELTDVEKRADALIQLADPPIEPQYKSEVRTRLIAALTITRETLHSLIADEQTYFRDLVNLEANETSLIHEAEKFRAFIDKTVLWTRSAPRLGVGDLGRTGRALAWFVSPANWRDLVRALIDSVRRSPLLAPLAVLVAVALIILRSRLFSQVRLLGKHVNNYGPGAMRRTFWAMVMTFLAAAGWPGVLLLGGLALSYGGDASSFADAIGYGLITVAAGGLPLAFVIQICRPEGLGETFFRWPTDALRRKVRSLRWLVVVELPLLFVAATLENQPVTEYRESLGRIACAALLAVLGGYVAWMFWPAGRMVTEGIGRRRTGWLYRFRLVWYPLAVVVPLWLAGAAVMGYYYTTLQLSGRLLAQLWVVILLVVLQAALRRWFTIGAARLARARQSEPPIDAAPPGTATAQESELPTVSEATAQVRQFADYFVVILTLVSLWAVWADVLPALGVLSDVALWKTGTGDGAVTVSLADLALSVILLVLTVIASKNTPGILEVAILRRLRIEPGVSYAINAMVRYIIALVGVVMAAQAIGIGWGHVQWLIAGVSVGLGFGLQEIFGNFISGLILLFEQPIRIGDVVTVGDVSGTVTRIRIRATTVLDWDRKELVVPNKEFITGRLVNWTLSDTILRIVIPVGIAYGSDTRLAHKLLLKVANEHPRVLKNPEPSAYFLGFSDSTLNFDLRVYIASINDFLGVRNDVHMAIDDEFRKAGVEIAFPQRDVHIRSVKRQ